MRLSRLRLCGGFPTHYSIPSTIVVSRLGYKVDSSFHAIYRQRVKEPSKQIILRVTGKRGELASGQRKAKPATPKLSSGAAAAAEKEQLAVIEQRGVVHDGIVDFLDTPGAREAVAKSAKRKQRVGGKLEGGGAAKKLGSAAGRVGRPSPKAVSVQSHKKRKART